MEPKRFTKRATDDIAKNNDIQSDDGFSKSDIVKN